MRAMEPSSVDSIVTDPPYELGFMGKAWDASGIANSVEMWREALRVLKPGGHLLAFSGSRTYHRMVCAIEDAGFEIRDQIMWVYGSGFPKSLDVSKAIDKAAGAEREVVDERTFSGKAAQDWKDKGGDNFNAGGPSSAGLTKTVGITAPATDAARQWVGWGTALKPAHEPICVARKPLIGTVAANVLAHGTGAINVDGCRVPGWSESDIANLAVSSGGGVAGEGVGAYGYKPIGEIQAHSLGRWPANVIHDGSDEVVAAFPDIKTGALNTWVTTHVPESTVASFQKGLKPGHTRYANHAASDGSAARFFYCAKANKDDRSHGNIHPTVKPNALMRYLCRLVTPPDGLILDPFMGSGSTGKAAMLEGFRFVGCELSEEYSGIATDRIEEALRGLQNTFDFSESPLQSTAR